MSLFLILILVFILYARTLNYNYIIDDVVKREGYLWDVPEAGPPPGFWDTKPSRWYRLFMIATHCVNVTAVYYLFGWGAALLFAVHPVCVCGTAWVTGNYYATTALFVLTAFYFINTFQNIFGALAGSVFFAVSLQSTVTAMTFPFLFFVTSTPLGLITFVPLVMFLRSKRWIAGSQTRENIIATCLIDMKFTPRRLILMTKVVARYIHHSFIPAHLGFFDAFGNGISESQQRYDWMHKANSEFWGSLALCLSVFIAGLFINPIGTWWFFVLIGLFSRWKMLGQFYAIRYLYLPLIGICAIAGTFLEAYPLLMTAVVTLFIFRTFMFIPTWRHQEMVWENDVKNFPHHWCPYNNLAQWQLNCGKTLSHTKIARVSYLLAKADELAPHKWEIQMNIACFNFIMRRTDLALINTRSAIKNLQRVSKGTPLPLQRLLKQERDMAAAIERDTLINKSVVQDAKQARLGESLSLLVGKTEK